MDEPNASPTNSEPEFDGTAARSIEYAESDRDVSYGDRPSIVTGSDIEVLSPTPAKFRELFATVAIVILSDVTVFRGSGFAGYAALLAGCVILLRLGATRAASNRYVWLSFAMVELLVARVLWAGSISHVVFGIFLVVAFATAQQGRIPFMLEVLSVTSRTFTSGLNALKNYAETLRQSKIPVSGAQWSSVLFPLIACAGFGIVFLLANPDLFTMFSGQIELFLQSVREWLDGFSVFEVLFWAVTFLVSAGLLRPSGQAVDFDQPSPPLSTDPQPSPLFPAFRNTLVTLIGLFIVYLVYEFRTLWFREFPQGFYYSGYAHEGAAWLTIALAMATLMLSMIFRGNIFQDERLSKLKRMAWIWSGLNLVLASAVYNRLMIYVGFNGMTRMRIVGFFGITTVVVGFILVVAKIVNRHNFGWLIRRQLWALGVAVYLYLLIPVDWIWVEYNVRRILAGDSAPSVQLAVHSIDADAVPVLIPLLECEDERVREGIRSLLAMRDKAAQRTLETQHADGWTAYQFSSVVTIRRLGDSREKWREFLDFPGRSNAAFQAFYDYSYQWY